MHLVPTNLTKKAPFLKNGLILLHIVSVIIGFSIFIFNYQLSEKAVVQKALAKQAVLAKSGSLSVENLIKNVQNQLSSFIFSFSNVSETSTINKEATRVEFAAYVQRAQLPINSVSLYDETGKLVILENRKHIYTGEKQDFSQTAVIQWSKNPTNKDKTFISTPYIATTGEPIGRNIIIVAKPIYFGKTYKGTLAIKLLIDDFRNDFITPLISDLDEDSFVINKTGILLAGNAPLINQNLFSWAKKQKWNKYTDFINKLTIALKTNFMQTTWTFQAPNDKLREFLVGINKIDIPDTSKDLYMVVSRSKESTLASLTPLRAYGLVWLGFGVLLTFLVGVIIISLSASD